LKYGTERLYSATSVGQAQEFVRKQSRLKVLGTRHCFNHIADSTDNFLSVRPLDKVIALDPQARTVTISAGMSYGQLSPIFMNMDLPSTTWLPFLTFRWRSV